MSDDPDFVRPPVVPTGFLTRYDEGGKTLQDLVAGTTGGGGAADLNALTAKEDAATTEGTAPLPKEYFCGIRQWRPKRLQVFRNAKFFTFLLCCDCFIEGALVSGFTSVVLSTIEKRYRFPSVAAGVIAASFDVAVLISVLFISYFGGKGHKPRWLGVSLIVMGIGSFVFSLPQFLFGSYDIGRDATLRFEACADGEDFSSDCDGVNGFALAFFIAGQLLIGVGAAPLFTVGTAYIDEIVHPKHVSLHLGVFYALTIIGPALGYGLGGGFLSIYVDPWHSTTLEPSDPGWVGAWWLCFIFTGIVCIALSIPFFLFPKLLPDSDHVRQARQEEMAKVYKSRYGEREDTDFATGVKTLPTHIKSLCTNPSWLLITIALTSSIIVVSGMASFAPKYIESQFHLTASTASILAGAVGIPAGGSGVIAGALIIYFTKSKGRRVALFKWTVSLISILPIFLFLLHCPTVNLVGVKEPYPDGSINDDLDSSCTIDCNCTSSTFEPVCGSDGLTYFSPCRAGCQKIPGTEIFENCTCIAQRQVNELGVNTSGPSIDYMYLVEQFHSNSTASDGKCDGDCDHLLGIFLALIAVTLFIVFMLQVPNVIITVRCVAEQQRALALGLQSVVWRTFGSIPGPILFGGLFDSACIYWQDECGRRGNCWVYENTDLSERALSVGVIGVFFNFLFSFLCWLVYPRKNEVETQERGKEEETSEISLSELKGGSTDGHRTSKGIHLRPVHHNGLPSSPKELGEGEGEDGKASADLSGAW